MDFKAETDQEESLTTFGKTMLTSSPGWTATTATNVIIFKEVLRLL